MNANTALSEVFSSNKNDISCPIPPALILIPASVIVLSVPLPILNPHHLAELISSGTYLPTLKVHKIPYGVKKLRNEFTIFPVSSLVPKAQPSFTLHNSVL